MWITKGYRREYPPWVIKSLAEKNNVKILIPEDYGADLGYKHEEYLHKNVEIATQREIFENAEYIVCLTTPSPQEINLMKKGQTLIAFLHYTTHPEKTRLLYEKGIHTISLDDIKDESGKRTVEDLKTTAYNSIKAAIIELRKQLGEEFWFDKKRKPLKFYVVGAGMVGIWAIQALNRFGMMNFQQELVEKGGNPKSITIPLDIFETRDKEFMNKEVLPNADIIVDATFRPKGENTRHVLTGEQLGLLPEHSIICDTAADKYDLSVSPPVVKAFQGIPTGTVEKYVFYPDDPAWENPEIVPKPFQIPIHQRRTVVSSYSWPSYGTNNDRRKNMEHYAQQIYPFLEFLAENGIEGIKPPIRGKTSPINDALFRALNPEFVKKKLKITIKSK